MSYSILLYFTRELLTNVNGGGCNVNIVYNRLLYKKATNALCIGGLCVFIAYIKFYIYIY